MIKNTVLSWKVTIPQCSNSWFPSLGCQFWPCNVEVKGADFSHGDVSLVGLKCTWPVTLWRSCSLRYLPHNPVSYVLNLSVIKVFQLFISEWLLLFTRPCIIHFKEPSPHQHICFISENYLQWLEHLPADAGIHRNEYALALLTLPLDEWTNIQTSCVNNSAAMKLTRHKQQGNEPVFNGFSLPSNVASIQCE